MNPLKTEEEVTKYKEWLSSKGTHYLNCILNNFERDKKKIKPVYINIDLRIELLTQELKTRITNK
jgi:hypothetical protein